ncbi:MAG: hypothetical protein ACR2RF_18375, partial [Geminicoccaceae bacterium]
NGGFDTQAIAVTVTDVNDAPIITSDGGGATANVNAPENQTGVTTVTSTDVDGGAPAYSIIGGADAAFFTINATTGVLTFNTAPDFEIPGDAGANNVYDVTVQVADGNGGFDTQAIAVTVTNVNEAPTITSDGGGPSAALNAAENQTAVTTVTSSDVDGGTPSYSITGGADAALFAINAATGVLTFNSAPDFETPADAGTNNVYDVTVEVDDGNGGADTQAIAVTVTNVSSDGGGILPIPPEPREPPGALTPPTQIPDVGGTDGGTTDPSDPGDDSDGSDNYGLTEPADGSSKEETFPELADGPSEEGMLPKPVPAEPTLDPAPEVKIAMNQSGEAKQTGDHKHDLGLSELNRAALWNALDRTQSDIRDESDFFGITLTQISVGTSVTLTAGFVTWVLRGGALASALLTSMPAWQRFDPLMLIQKRRREDEEDKKTTRVDRIFDEMSRSQDRSE